MDGIGYSKMDKKYDGIGMWKKYIERKAIKSLLYEDVKQKRMKLWNKCSLCISVVTFGVLTIMNNLNESAEIIINEKILNFSYLVILLPISSLIISNYMERRMYDFKYMKFKDMNSVMEFIVLRVDKAQRSIRDFTWLDAPYAPTNIKIENTVTGQETKFFNKIINKIVSSKGQFVYEQIFTFTKGKSDRRSEGNRFVSMKNSVEAIISMENESYRKCYKCGYYDTGNMGKDNNNIPMVFPKIQFILFDDDLVVFTNRRYNNELCAIQQEAVVKIFADYATQAINGAHIMDIDGWDKENFNQKISDLASEVDKNFVSDSINFSNEKKIA